MVDNLALLIAHGALAYFLWLTVRFELAKARGKTTEEEADRAEPAGPKWRRPLAQWRR